MHKLIRVLAVLALLAVASSAQAFIMLYDTPLGMTGAQETPPIQSPASGDGTATYDSGSHTLDVYMIWSDLTALATVSHIHTGPGPGAAGPVAISLVGFPNATSGTYSMMFDLTNPGVYTASFLSSAGGTAAAAEALLFDRLQAGRAYLNIHTTPFPAGEIRGDLAPVNPVPEPTTVALFGLGVVLALAWSRGRA